MQFVTVLERHAASRLLLSVCWMRILKLAHIQAMGFHSTFNAVKEFADISLKHCKSLKCFGESLPASMQTVRIKTHEPVFTLI